MGQQLKSKCRRDRAVIPFVLLAVPAAVFAQTDEIQVYDAEIAEPGVFNLMVHTNFTPIERKTPGFPGGIIPNDSVNGAWEWAYGVTDWFGRGLYLPVYSPYSDGRGVTINGFKLRELFVRPHAHDHMFCYGVNFEFSVNHKYWESRRITSEVRPIVGLHLHQVDFIFNHEVWAVMDHNTKALNIEAGVGFGVTAGADKLTFKLMLSRDLNSRSEN